MTGQQRKPLFILDCDGTLDAFSGIFVYGLMKQLHLTDMSLTEFKKEYGIGKVMFPGMANLVKYMAEQGNVVLLSGGDPVNEGSAELKSLIKEGCFQNWKFNGADVPLGKEPEGVHKSNPLVARALLKEFDPSYVVVIGDSEDECKLAENIAADALLMRGDAQSILEKAPNIPHKSAHLTGSTMKEELNTLLRDYQPRFRRRRVNPFSRRNLVYKRDRELA